MNTTSHIRPASRPSLQAASDGRASGLRILLAVAALLLEAAALASVVVDGPRFASIAWVPGWAALGVALLQFRAGRWPRLLAVGTAVLFVAGTVIGIHAGLR